MSELNTINTLSSTLTWWLWKTSKLCLAQGMRRLNRSFLSCYYLYLSSVIAVLAESLLETQSPSSPRRPSETRSSLESKTSLQVYNTRALQLLCLVDPQRQSPGPLHWSHRQQVETTEQCAKHPARFNNCCSTCRRPTTIWGYLMDATWQLLCITATNISCCSCVCQMETC